MTPRFNYLELPTDDIERSREFYRQSFGWDFTAFGPSYSATVSDDTDVGLDASPDKNLTSALPVIEVADLDAVFARVRDSGGTITADIFDFPGGRRFHFTDPDGHQLGVWERSQG
ncbi:MAG: VOC family protein [Sphingomonadales bacterium]|nr:VOC family protein [Sphingomonadales bacterium]